MSGYLEGAAEVAGCLAGDFIDYKPRTITDIRVGGNFATKLGIDDLMAVIENCAFGSDIESTVYVVGNAGGVRCDDVDYRDAIAGLDDERLLPTSYLGGGDLCQRQGALAKKTPQGGQYYRFAKRRISQDFSPQTTKGCSCIECGRTETWENLIALEVMRGIFLQAYDVKGVYPPNHPLGD